MATRIENRIEELIFDVAEELKLTDAQVQNLDAARLGALALARLRVDLENEAREPHTQERHSLANRAATSLGRLMLRLREALAS